MIGLEAVIVFVDADDNKAIVLGFWREPRAELNEIVVGDEFPALKEVGLT